MSTETLTAKGQFSSTVSFDGRRIVITRGRMSPQGRSTKTIPLKSISSVQFKPASLFTRGFLAFSLSGGDERQSVSGRQAYQANLDENSLAFTSRKVSDDFAAIADAVNDALVEAS